MYDVVVLGSGPGGYVAALRAASQGAKVCCIEEKYIGGTCLNVGCIPTKAMLHGSELYWHMKHADDYGFGNIEAKVDDGKFMARTAKVVSGLKNGVGFLLKSRKVDVVNGRGEILDANTIKVTGGDGEKEVKAKAIIIATGSQPVRPGFLPWDSDALMTTDEATTAKELPKSVLILGGGVIGCEFATVYAELGIETTIVEMLEGLVVNLDKDVSKAIVKSLKKRKVNILVGSKVTGMKVTKKGVVTEIEGGDPVTTEKVLVAVGRKPNTEGIGLEKLGVEMDGPIIKVNENCQTNVPNVYAIGDVAEFKQYAHMASRMGIVAADNAIGKSNHDNRSIVPVGVYTHPEVATVGMSEDEAKKASDKVKVATFGYKASGMAQAYGETEGMVKLIAEEEFGSILGAVVIGPHATDVIQEVAVAMKNELTVEEIAETIHPHPTFVEAVGEAAEAWLGYPLHSM